MGSEVSQEEYDRVAQKVYADSSWRLCLPDVGIDESLLKYSGLNSTAELQAYSNQLVDSVPGYLESVGSSLASFDSVPNAVGLGALMISIILDILIKSTTGTKDDSYNMLRRVFGEEKASAVRDTMSEYLKRHEMSMKNEQDLLQELQNLERRLSHDLTTLRNSLLHDGQMSTRGFKIWVNGASFHIQMLIHKARLINQTGQSLSRHVNTVSVAIDLYLRDLDKLLKKYKTYKVSITSVTTDGPYGYGSTIQCVIENVEYPPYQCIYSTLDLDFCGFWRGKKSKYIEAYVNNIFKVYKPITSLKSHFLNVKKNLNTVIKQHDTFTLYDTFNL